MEVKFSKNGEKWELHCGVLRPLPPPQPPSVTGVPTVPVEPHLSAPPLPTLPSSLRAKSCEGVIPTCRHRLAELHEPLAHQPGTSPPSQVGVTDENQEMGLQRTPGGM